MSPPPDAGTPAAVRSGSPLALGYATLALLVLGLGGWGSLATLSGAVVASGRIEVEQSRQVVQHPDGGLVAELAVREGDRVAAGALLVRLDASALASELAIVEAELHEIMARRARLEAERDGTGGLGQRSLLDRGLAEAGRVQALEREAARLRGSLGELVAARGAAGERIAEIDLEILRLGDRLREEAIAGLRDIHLRERELAERRAALSLRLERLEIRAPVAGAVLALAVSGPGAVVRPAEPVAQIVPDDRPLVVAARIRATDVDQVFPGQPATLRLPIFDRQLAPEVAGRVARLSADAFTDERSGQAFYRAEIVLDEGAEAQLAGLDLVPGMPVEAYLRTGAQSPLAYLVQPLAAYLSRALREG
jgi:HlyD family secretion protein